MTPQEIKANAPQGATHYREYKIQYFKMVGNYLYKWDGRKWQAEPFPYFCNIIPL